MTVTEVCPPEFPPVSISIGTKRSRTVGRIASKPPRMVDEKVAETIKRSSHGILDLKIENTDERT